jgi:hypothetical protein
MKTSENLQQCPAGGFFVFEPSCPRPFASNRGKGGERDMAQAVIASRNVSSRDFRRQMLVLKESRGVLSESRA